MVTVFVEGGGKRGNKTLFQRQFSRLIAKATRGASGGAVSIVACGARGDALRRFERALSEGRFRVILLVDSERPVQADNRGKPWAHLAEPPDHWEKPAAAEDNHAHLMAQCMESWFIADTDALQNHFGRGFKPAKLPGNPDVEEVAKSDVMSGLESSVRETQRGEYHKTRDGFALIGIIDPSRVAKRAPHAKRFFDALRQKLGAKQDE